MDDSPIGQHGPAAEYFISCGQLDDILIYKFSHMVILLLRPESCLTVQENVEDIFKDTGFLRIRVQRLADSAFLLSASHPPSSHTVCSNKTASRCWNTIWTNHNSAMVSAIRIRRMHRHPISVAGHNRATMWFMHNRSDRFYPQFIQSTRHSRWWSRDPIWGHNLQIQMLRLVHRCEQHHRPSEDQEAAT